MEKNIKSLSPRISTGAYNERLVEDGIAAERQIVCAASGFSIGYFVAAIGGYI
jgi:hypothetical protein